MAKKTFSDLQGVILEVTCEGKKREVHDMRERYKEVKIKHSGDIFYWLDKDNNFELRTGVVKINWQRSYGGSSMKYSLDVEGSKNYLPCFSSYEDKKFNSDEVNSKIRHFNYKGNRSHYGLFFTTEEDALEWQAKLREGKMFAGLKKGDKVYCLSDKHTDKPYELTLLEIRGHNREHSDEYELHFDNEGEVYIGTSIYEDRSNEQLDAFFYTYKSNLGHNVKLFINEKDAIKFVADTVKRKKKNATDKYIKKMENHDGKPITHKDNLGHDLHYGDTVAYIRRTGYNSHPEIRIGVIVGESKTKITVFDSDEKKNGKPVGWGNTIEQTDGKHSIEKQSVLLIESAKVDEKSSFVFVK